MVTGYVIQIRDVYRSKFTDHEQVRRLMFEDLLELEVTELMERRLEWRGDWISTGKLPLIGGPSESELRADGHLADDATCEEIESAILRFSHPIDRQIIDDIWSAIDEAMQLIPR